MTHLIDPSDYRILTHHYGFCFTLWELDIALGGKVRPHVTHMVKLDDA